MVHKERLSTRAAVIEAGFRVLGRDPSASLSQVAIAAGVGRATLHRHFPGRGDLIEALVSQAAAELDAAATAAAKGAGSHTEALKRIMAAVIALGDRQWFLATEKQAADLQMVKDVERRDQEFRRLMKAAQSEGLFSQSCPLEWAIAAFDHLVYAAWILVRDGEATPKQASRLAWQTLTAGIGKARL